MTRSMTARSTPRRSSAVRAAKSFCSAGVTPGAEPTTTNAIRPNRAAAKGEPYALFHLGVLFAEAQGVRRDYTKAREWYEKAVAKDEPHAITQLGLLHENGRGGPQDFAKAREWHDQASAAGEDRGSRNLAILLDNGRGGPVDYPRAAQLVLAAARAGNAEALRELRGTVAKWNPQTVLELKRELANLRLYKGAVTPGWDAAARTAVEAFLQAQ